MNKADIITNSKIFQRDVYRFAGELLSKNKLKSVLDIGCGYPEKIREFVLPVTNDIVGIDSSEVIKFVKEDINFGQWIECDIGKEIPDINRNFDLIICADVIEHLDNPDVLLNLFDKYSNKDTYILISTPDGDTTLKQKNGNPANILHKREWGRESFKAYLQGLGLDILKSNYAVEQQDKYSYICNYFLCKKDNLLRKKSILITVPNLHYIHKIVTHRLMKLQQDNRYKLNFKFPSNKPYENNLHHIVKDFLEGSWDFWLNIDSDNPPMENPLDLVELDKDIIGLPTPIWHFKDDGKKGERPVYWNAYDYVSEKDAYSEHQPREGLQKVDAVGTGCILIARRVFLNENMQQGAFTRKLYPDGRVHKGNDISFCERARNQNFEIYCHYDYPCQHFNKLELNEIVKAFRNLYEK